MRRAPLATAPPRARGMHGSAAGRTQDADGRTGGVHGGRHGRATCALVRGGKERDRGRSRTDRTCEGTARPHARIAQRGGHRARAVIPTGLAPGWVEGRASRQRRPNGEGRLAPRPTRALAAVGA